MKTVLVLGATSPTAQAFIQLLQTDYPDTAIKLFVRNPAKLPADQRTAFPIFTGDANTATDLIPALDNVTHVYTAVGGTGTGNSVSALLSAIQTTQAPIEHIVDISAGGIYGEYQSGLRPYLSAVRFMYPGYTKEQLRKPDLYAASGIAYTIFRPGLIQNGPETQLITHLPDYRKISPAEFDINRSTFARAAANALFKGQYHNQSLSVSNGAPL